jgi:hypothetical protein
MNKMFACAIIVGVMALFMAPAFAKVGDINGDGKVDLQDLVLLAKAYGSTPDKPNWNPLCDLNNNGRVDLTDLVTLVTCFSS